VLFLKHPPRITFGLRCSIKSNIQTKTVLKKVFQIEENHRKSIIVQFVIYEKPMPVVVIHILLKAMPD
jgi:hypothetical protein